MSESSTRLERFAHHLLQVDARNTVDVESGTFVVFGGLKNATIHVSEGALESRLAALVEPAHAIWPDVDAELASFRLLSEHLIERIETGTSGSYTIASARIE